MIYKCKACMDNVPRQSAGHTGIPGECRWQEIDYRQSTKRERTTHPKTPRVKARQEMGQGLPGTSASGELGQEMEEAALRQLGVDPDFPQHPASSSSADGNRPPDTGPEPSNEGTVPDPMDGPPTIKHKRKARDLGYKPR